MRVSLAIILLTSLLGCAGPGPRLRGNIEIENALEKRVSAAEARAFVLAELDRHLERLSQMEQTDTVVSEKKAVLLSRDREASRVEEFLRLQMPADELWTYRTFVTPDLRGGESGLAVLRRGLTVAHMALTLYN